MGGKSTSTTKIANNMLIFDGECVNVPVRDLALLSHNTYFFYIFLLVPSDHASFIHHYFCI